MRVREKHEMKDSGIEWIGDIPNDWRLSKLKSIVSTIKGFAFKANQFFTEGIPIIKASNMKRNTIENVEVYLSTNEYMEYRKVVLNKNDVLMTTVGSNPVVVNSAVGQISKVPKKYDKSVLNQNIVKLIPDNNIANDYLYYIVTMHAYRKYLDLIAHGTANQSSISLVDALEYQIALPAIDDQHSIVTYLTQKTQKIDFVINSQKQLIQKLKEYKQSIITESVTKGLDSDVPMKDSGVEWIGDVPVGWGVKRLRYVGTLQNGISKAGSFFGSGYPFVSYGDVYNTTVLPTEVNGLAETTSKEQDNHSVLEGDVFFTRTSETIEEIGLVSVCLNSIEKATFAGFLIRFRPYRNVISKHFSKYYFHALIHRRFFVKEMNLVTRASLSQELLKCLPVLLPTKQEQQRIAEYLDKKCTQIDKAIADKQRIIDKMIEYKKSLIYEVVTGKVEV